MSSYEKIAAYLEAHPTPWRYVEAWPEDTIGYAHWADEGEGFDGRWKSDSIDVYEAVVDATGQVVLRSNDEEGLKSWLGGDVRALVDFVNLVGMDYEPPCGWPGVDYGPIEPVDAGPYRRRLSDADVERLDSGRKRRFTGGTVEEFLRRALSGEGE